MHAAMATTTYLLLAGEVMSSVNPFQNTPTLTPARCFHRKHLPLVKFGWCLQALRQQERDMEDTRRQHALAAAAAASAGNGASFPPGMDGWDPATAELLAAGQLPDPGTLQQSPAGIGALAGLGTSGDRYLGGSPVDAGQFEAMIRSGGMSVVLGEGGEAVCGPGGEPVIVGPAGQELAVDPSGQIRPYTPRSAMA